MLKFGKHFKSISRLKAANYGLSHGLRHHSSGASAALSLNRSLKVGHNLHGYQVQAIEDVPELCLSAYLLTHVKSGAQHLHLYREDTNNLFGVSLRTTPTDSTGVAHILEHLSLCGSHQFPCRDPFMKMLSRSLATFMNAFTSPDNTMYPFSTQNTKDFNNLMSIYLDAVFFPRLRRLDFNQEGWRLEHHDINDPNSEIGFKGVVFNEMKGYFSTPAAIYSRKLQNHLFPSNTYANESGGDPLAIPDLTYEALKEFHSRHYHPSNARFITYGNFPLESHLAFINDYVLSRFTFNEDYSRSSQVPDQPKWSKPVHEFIESQPDPMVPFPDKQTTVSVNFMLEDITNTHENFTLAILCSLLMDGPNALLANTYANESGGDPLAIPDLTYEALKEFHSRHYHPSNARFITYGNFPLESHLAFINDYVLSRFTFNEDYSRSSQVPDQPKWSKPVHTFIESQPDPYQGKGLFETSEDYLPGLRALYQALIESGLGSDFSPNSGFANHTKQSFFSIGLQGIAKNQVNYVIKAVDTALKNAINDGFPEERIEAILHRVELQTKHQTSNYGLGLMMNLNPLWTHGGNPLVGLRVNEHVNTFRAQLKQNPKFLTNKIKERFISNTHRLVLEMNPSEEYENNLKEKEQKLLNEKLSKLSEKDLKEIYENGLELDRIQKNKDDVSVLPTLSVKKDISRRFNATAIETTQILNADIQWSAQPTNGITYFNAILKPKANSFPHHLVPYLPVFSQVVTNNPRPLDLALVGYLKLEMLFPEVISSHCLDKNIDQMFRLWTDIFNRIRFDDDYDHLLQLIRMCSAEMNQSLPYHGHRYAMNRSASSLGGAFKYRELTSGLSSVSHFRSLASLEDCKPIVQNLKSIASLLLNADSIRCSINAEAPTIRPSLQTVERFIQSINKSSETSPQTESLNVNIPAVEPTLSEHHVFPFGANYLANRFIEVALHSLFPPRMPPPRLESRPPRILMNSYRDPNVDQTINAFNSSAEWLSDQNNYSDQDVDEAKLSVFQDVDHPIMPSEQGLECFVNGITDQMKHDYRMRLLDVTKTDIEEVAQRYLVNETSKSGVILIGPRNDRTVSDAKWLVTEEKPNA
ncbi:unnamed protein product [Oppiella nova]|uniref:Presequence protease, mitochondrial n=1 Tax=Oppiella nova TaxID=334625 RepID=A0A7R9LHW6_9ACAR|nr:unnamed protein product [Oppiella nova]CAG2163811.1 unnamed protein product [Oppiella nova]